MTLSLMADATYPICRNPATLYYIELLPVVRSTRCTLKCNQFCSYFGLGDSRACHARPNCEERTGTGTGSFSLFSQLTTNDTISTRFGLGVENDRADVGRDSRAYLARPNSSERTGQVPMILIIRRKPLIRRDQGVCLSSV